MLGKLIKHEIKAQYKTYFAMYLFLLVLSVVALSARYLFSNSHSGLQIIYALTTFLFFAGLIAVFVITAIFSVLRFRKNLFKDQGYLMHTLPVSSAQLFYSKLISTMIWYVADSIIAFFTIAIAVLNINWIGYIVNLFKVSMYSSGISIDWIGTFTIVYIIICIIAQTSQFYVSISIGHISNKSKDGMSFVAFLCTYGVSQLLTFIGLVIVAFKNFGSLSLNKIIDPNVISGYFGDIYIMAAVVLLILTAAYHIIAIKIMDKKLNLE